MSFLQEGHGTLEWSNLLLITNTEFSFVCAVTYIMNCVGSGKKYTNGKKTPVVSVGENSISNLRQTRQKRRFTKRCHPERVGIGVHQNLTKCKTELVHVANFGRLLQSFGREDVSGRRSVN